MTTIKVLDRPRSGDDLEARQHRWDEACTEVRMLEHEAWIARRAVERRGGSRRVRAIFAERVVARAVKRWEAEMTAARAAQSEVGELVSVRITDWTESPVYDTVPGRVLDRPDPRTETA